MRVRHRGIDASHHQGSIDWRAVAGDGITFAYLKATEGTSYTDPTFAQHRSEALDLGLRVGGYHYFQLCSSGAEQAAHFASVLGDLGGGNLLPGAVDLELAGSCATPPARDVLLAEVRTFLEEVEAMTGKEPVVYLFPEFEEAYDVAAELGDHRQWVRSLDGRPDREWWIWQQTRQRLGRRHRRSRRRQRDVGQVRWLRCECSGLETRVILLEDDFWNSRLRGTVGPSCPRST